MFVNLNETSLPVTASSTPAYYSIPENVTRFRIFNDAGATIVVKAETGAATTLTAPSAGTKFTGTAIANQGVEMFDTDADKKGVSVYSVSGTGTVYIQFTYGQ